MSLKKEAVCIQLNLFLVVLMTAAQAFKVPPVVKAYKYLMHRLNLKTFFFPPRINGHLQPLFFITESFSFSRR